MLWWGGKASADAGGSTTVSCIQLTAAYSSVYLNQLVMRRDVIVTPS